MLNYKKFHYSFYLLITLLFSIAVILFLISILFINYFTRIKTGIDNGSCIIAIVTILGSLLVVAGTIWGQKKSNEKKEQTEIKKNAQIIAFDLQSALNIIENIIQEVPIFEISKAREAFRKYPFTVLPNWRLLVLSIGHKLEENELSYLLSTYESLVKASVLNYNIDSFTLEKKYNLCRDINILKHSGNSWSSLIEKIKKI